MPYLGNIPASEFRSIDYQDFTGVTGSPAKRGFTLTSPVSNANDLEVFVNNVRQEPGVAYTVASTTLTMTGDVETTDDFYVVYQGKATGTVSVPDGSVTSAKLDTNIAISGNLDVGGRILTPARPAFRAWNNVADSSVNASSSDIKVNFDTEMFDIGGNFDLANSKFITPVTGLYFLSFAVYLGSTTDVTAISAKLYLDGNRQWPTSANRPSISFVQGGASDPEGGTLGTSSWSGVVPLVANEELEVYFKAVGDTSVTVQIYGTDFSGYLIG